MLLTIKIITVPYVLCIRSFKKITDLVVSMSQVCLDFQTFKCVAVFDYFRTFRKHLYKLQKKASSMLIHTQPGKTMTSRSFTHVARE